MLLRQKDSLSAFIQAQLCCLLGYVELRQDFMPELLYHAKEGPLLRAPSSRPHISGVANGIEFESADKMRTDLFLVLICGNGRIKCGAGNAAGAQRQVWRVRLSERLPGRLRWLRLGEPRRRCRPKSGRPSPLRLGPLHLHLPLSLCLHQRRIYAGPKTML